MKGLFSDIVLAIIIVIILLGIISYNAAICRGFFYGGKCYDEEGLKILESNIAKYKNTALSR